MINGGHGISPLIEEPVFKWLYSDEALSELGIESTDVDELVRAHQRAYSVNINANQLSLNFGDISVLKAATQHPFDGIGALSIGSWLEWVHDGQNVTDAGFVDRDDLPDRLTGYIRLPDPLGGLMLPRGSFGSAGTWKVPPIYNNYISKWMTKNKPAIIDAMTAKLISLLNK